MKDICSRCKEEHEIWATIHSPNLISQFCKPCAKKMGYKK